jgi:hypothetical protein
MAGSTQLSRGGAVAMGLVFMVCGIPPILIGLGLITPSPADGPTPAWVAICAGLLFVFGGLALIVDYAIAGGVGPDGDLRPGTPFAIRLANFLLGMAIVGCMTAIFGWVAFGPGPRQFSSTLSLPLVAARWASGEATGRAAFGAATVLFAIMFVACSILGVKRLWRVRRA